jgi:uncharacterized membrane protein YphA (DoxX/SURF4 family)
MLKLIWHDLFKSHVHLGSFLLRLGLAMIFMFHGYLKLSQGGGRQWSDILTEGTQVTVAWGETITGFALLFGLFSRLAAIVLVVIMIGAIQMQTGDFGFIYLAYNRPNPAKLPTGWEYNFALIIMSLAVLALGSGKVSLDYLFFGRGKGRQVDGH